MYESRDPNTGESLGVWPEQSPQAIEHLLADAAAAQHAWAGWSFQARALVLRRAADLLDARALSFSRLMAREMGKPLAQGESEARKCAWVCRYYADHAESLLAPEPIASDASQSGVRYEPLGVVLAIMPWNFPFWQVFRFAAPALMAGNAMVLKHAPTTQGCARAILALLEEAGVPSGLVANLVARDAVVAQVLADARIRAVTLTGSERAGASVAATAGRHLKKLVLELGGSDPFVVLEDADVERAAEVAAQARLLNSGQSCIAAKRFIVVQAVAERFLTAFRRHLEAEVLGDPMDAEVTIGPMARADLREALHKQVTDSIAVGAHCVLGGRMPEGPGFYYPVTLLTHVAPGMPAWDEEVFGPVAAVRIVADAEEAVSAANDTAYGLGASLWTERTDLIGRIEAGAVFVNGLVKSDPRLPFGGIKRSGYGRELGRHGLHEFVNPKTFWIA